MSPLLGFPSTLPRPLIWVNWPAYKRVKALTAAALQIIAVAKLEVMNQAIAIVVPLIKAITPLLQTIKLLVGIK
jgi:hypothetical protein